MGTNYNQLSRYERMKIEALYDAGFNGYQIAKQLKRHHTTIYRELNKGKTTKVERTFYKEIDIYSSDLGQAKYEKAKRKCGRCKKIEGDQEFIEYVEYMVIDWHYSPQAILYDIEENGMEFNTKICLSTLYNYIRQGVFENIELADCPYKRKKGKKKNKVQKRLSVGLSIEERPKEIEDRTEYGHWEMDSVVGAKEDGGKAFLVMTERKTRNEIIMLVKDHTAGEVVKALNKLERKYGEKNFRNTFKTITVDNGKEFADYEGMMKSRRNKTIPRTQIYYCHAYRSCERGSNENQNRMIRRWYPKGTNFDNFTQSDANRIQDWMNEYPRKIFGGKSSKFMVRQEKLRGSSF